MLFRSDLSLRIVCVCVLRSPYLGRVNVPPVGADPPHAHASVPAAGAVGPGEVARLTHQLAAGLPRAPQAAAGGLHEGAGLGALAERQLALAVQAVGGAGEHFGQGQGLLRLVQQTLA